MGPVEILINNAGIMPIGPFLTMPPETARKAVEINTLGVLNGCRVVGQHMRHGRGGHIVNVASVAGRIAVPGMAAYNATKFAVVGFSEALSAELSPYGVQVSCVLPTFTKTALISGIRTGRAVKSIEPVDVADAVQRALAGKRFTSAPANIGPALTMWPVLPRRVRAALLRYTGLDEAFLHPDSSARAGYDRRIASDPSDRHPHGERETTI
jgi:short-subunit dehydrogenase